MDTLYAQPQTTTATIQSAPLTTLQTTCKHFFHKARAHQSLTTAKALNIGSEFLAKSDQPTFVKRALKGLCTMAFKLEKSAESHIQSAYKTPNNQAINSNPYTLINFALNKEQVAEAIKKTTQISLGLRLSLS